MGAVCDRWLGCCCFGAGTKEASLQFVPSSRRNCTDVLFFLLYVASWAGLIVVISVAAARGGNPEKILHGVNFNGSTCGSSEGVSELPYAAWVALPQTPQGLQACPDCYEILTCISDCNDTQSDALIIDHYESQRLMWYCIPVVSDGQNLSFPFSAQFNSASNLASRAFVDLYTVWPVILISAFVSVLLSFGYAFLAKRVAGLLIALTIVLLASGGFLLSYALLKMAAEADQTSVSDRSEAMRGIGITVAVVTAVFLIVVLALRKRIYIAVEVVKEASAAVLDLWDLIVFPIFPFLLGLGYFVLFIATTLLIVSVWTSTTTTLPPYILNSPNNRLPSSTYEAQAWDQSLRNAFAYVFFHLLWTIQFLVYLTFMVVAGAIANWYFTPRDAKGNKVRGEAEGQLSRFPVLGSVYRTLRFHLGTLALAALIIAVIEFVRAVVKYIEELTTPKHGPPNRLQKAVFCLIQCCLACVQCCLDKVSKNALVWCAIYGDNFAESACSSFALVWANLARVAALSLVSAFLMLVGKVLVAFLTTGCAAIAMFRYYDTTLNSLVLPCVVIFLLSYLVSALFMSLLETTVSTIFLCFLVDEKYNKQSGVMLASDGLQAVINAHKELGAAYAEREHQKATYRANGATPPPASGQPQLSSGSQPVVPNQHSYAPTGSHPHSAVQLTSAPSTMV